MQKDIDSLESERINLREHLKTYSSKKGDTKQPVTFGMEIALFLVSIHVDYYGYLFACFCSTIQPKQHQTRHLLRKS